jgi:hypothetical protein
MFGQKKSGFDFASLKKTAASFGITPNSIKKTAGSFGLTPNYAKKVGTQFATSAKAGLNARINRTSTGLQTRIAGAPPTPIPPTVQIPTPVKPPNGGF